jgi:putative ABC transport system substrate-binding protein
MRSPRPLSGNVMRTSNGQCMVRGPILTRMIAGVLLLLAGPLVVQAQPGTHVFRIGLLGTIPLSEPGSARIWGGLFEELRRLGYVEGKNLIVEGRYSEGKPERLPALAAELVRIKVDVIVAAAYTPGAAKAATSAIPIVMTNHGDPVGGGLVASLARPGGNVTGMSTLTVELVSKQLELLRQAMPRVSRVAVLVNPGGSHYRAQVRQAENAARTLAMRLQILQARAPIDLAGAFSAAMKESAGAVVIPGDPMFFGERTRIVELAAKSRVPLIANQSEYPEASGLLSYGTDQRDSFRRAASYVDRILKGAKPGDLPVEQATKFELVVNLKTAKTLGVMISPAVLARADRVIE